MFYFEFRNAMLQGIVLFFDIVRNKALELIERHIENGFGLFFVEIEPGNEVRPGRIIVKVLADGFRNLLVAKHNAESFEIIGLFAELFHAVFVVSFVVLIFRVHFEGPLVG